jgi:SAM-dependent methyltransferase
MTLPVQMTNDPLPNAKIQRAYRVRIVFFLLFVVLAVILLSAIYQGMKTITRLEVIERERDRWQQPAEVIHGDTDDPRLPAGVLDAVLVVNTYHELAHPKSILARLYRSLVSGGRLVIVDRGPGSVGRESREVEAKHHELPLSIVEEEIRQAGFEIIRQQNGFTEEPGHGPWWLIVARKP